ncbi:T9SS type A sorting domain-containing protein [Flavisolibacter sp. BT320]|nr:T9SS type A sorting domain-containing protein [Flavisolibacter longurius]
MKKLLLTLVSMCMLTAAFSQVGHLDPAYGDNGIKVLGPPVSPPLVLPHKTYPAEEGGYYAVYEEMIFKFLKDGTVDVTFGNSGVVMVGNYLPNGMFVYQGSVRQEDGRITVAGTDGGFRSDAYIFRFNPDGTLNQQVKVGSDEVPALFFFEEVQSITLQNDLVVVAGISFSSVVNSTSFFARVLYPDGEITEVESRHYFYDHDYSYSDGNHEYFYEGWSSFPRLPVGAVVENNGSVTMVVPGPYTETVTEVQGFIFHNFSIGNMSAMPAFPDDAYTPPPASNGKAVDLRSVENPATGNTDFLVTVYKDDGTIDESFGNNGSVQIDFGGQDIPKAYVWQGTQLIVGGNSTDPASGQTSFALARLNSNGSLDMRFDNDGKQLTFREGLLFNLQRLAIQQNGQENRLFAVGDKLIVAYILEEIGYLTLTCPSNIAVMTDAGLCTAVVNGIDPVVSPMGAVVLYTLGGATTGSGTGSVSGKVFNKGVTLVTYTLADDPSKSCSFTVTINDKEAPVISNVSASTTTLWPPNHKMVDVWVGYTLSDNCRATATLSVSSNEPQASTDPEDKSPDWIIVDAHRVQLRAERLGDGRIYTITVVATDGSGNSTKKSIVVTVPKNMGKNSYPTVNKGNHKDGKEKELLVSVLSNPSAGNFTLVLQSKSQKRITLRVSDAQGRVVETRSNLGAGTIQLGSRYKAGVYHVELVQGNDRVTVSLVKL